MLTRPRTMDGFIDFGDLGIVVRDFGSPPFDAPPADVNWDNVVDILDLALVARNLGKLAPRPLRAMQVSHAFPGLSFTALTNLFSRTIAAANYSSQSRRDESESFPTIPAPPK